MKAGVVRARRATNTAVAAVLYILCAAGTLLFLSRPSSATGEPGLYRGASGIVLAILPAASAALFVFLLAGMLRQRASRAWGFRMRFRLALMVMGSALAGFLPAASIYSSLAVQTAAAPASIAIRQAVDSGVRLSLRTYRDMDKALELLASRELPGLVTQFGTQADAILDHLTAVNGYTSGIQVFQNGQSIAFAGNPDVQAGSSELPDGDSPIPRVSANGISHIRYYKTGLPGGLSALLSLSVDPEVDEAAALLSSARRSLGESGKLARSTPFFALAFGLSLAFPLLVLALAMARSAADTLLDPLAALERGIRAVSDGHKRLPYLSKPEDETGQLVSSFNAMLEGLERSRGDDLRNERLGAWQDIARRLAHELRNPLTPIRLTAERVLRLSKGDPDKLADILEKSMVAIIQETAGMETLLSEFHDFAKLPEPQRDWVNVRSLVEETALLYSSQWPQLELDYSSIAQDIVVRADRGQLKQVLGNLLANAADASGGTGRVRLRADLVKASECLYCRLQVADNGTGIAKELGIQVFEPYFSTKSNGTGLGLAIVRHIVSAHGGRIWFESSEGCGTTFYVDIPALAAKEA